MHKVSSERRSGNGRAGLGQLWWSMAGVVLLAVATGFAIVQPPPADPFAAASWRDPEWWLFPRQRNPHLRLPFIDAPLNAVDAHMDGDGRVHVWAVGDRGLIVYSSDGGESWEERNIAPAMLAVDEEDDADEQEEEDAEERTEGGEGAVKSQAGNHRDASSVAPSGDRVQVVPAAYRRGIVEAPQAAEGLPAQNPEAKESYPPEQPDRSAPALEGEADKKAPEQDPEEALDAEGGEDAVESPLPWIRGILQVSAVDEDHLFCLAILGSPKPIVLLSSSDGGKTWERRHSFTISQLVGVESRPAERKEDQQHQQHQQRRQQQQQQQQRSALTLADAEEWEYELEFESRKEGRLRVNDRVLISKDGGTSWPARAPQSILPSEFGYSVLAEDDGRRFSVAVPGDRVQGGSSTVLTFNAQRPPRLRAASGAVAALIPPATGGNARVPPGLLITTDGGATWRRRGSFRAVQEFKWVDASRAFAVGDRFLWRTDDTGGSWHPCTRPWVSDSAFVDEETGHAVGAAGLFLSTKDGGATWAREETGFQRHLYAVEPVGPREILVGGEGVLLRRTDRWEVLHHEEGWHYLAFAPSSQGWRTLRIREGEEPQDILVASAADAVVEEAEANSINWLAALLRIARTSELIPDARVPPGYLSAMTSGETGFSLKYLFDLFVDHAAPPLSWFEPMNSSEPISEPSTLRAREPLVGREGVVFTPADDSETWERHQTGARVDLIAGSSIGADTILLTTMAGTVLRSDDGGETWTDPTLPFDAGLPPWWWLALLVSAGMVLIPFVSPRAAESEKPSVADVLVTDRPLERDDPDPLEFGLLARSIGRFIRNESTEPPLTIAVTGEWGCGKSSLMNLVHAHLRRHGYRPVWFNAWHHQREEHILAALLESVQSQAVPPFWRPMGGGRFRLRLFWRRARSHAWLALGVFFVFWISIGYVLADPAERLAEITAFWGSMYSSEDIIAQLAESIPSLGAVGGVLLGILGFLRAATAFGVRPASLLASVSGRPRLRDLKAQTSFRHRFMRQFKEVTSALRPRTPVIFIDDLDRCRPENMLEALEAINFLVSSGACIVVLGISEEPVLRCIGRAYAYLDGDEPSKSVSLLLHPIAASDEPGDPTASAAPASVTTTGKLENRPTQRKGSGRDDLARHYLEKVINIEVPVPPASERQRRRFLREATGGSSLYARRTIWGRCKAAFSSILAWTPVAACLLFAAAGLIVGIFFLPKFIADEELPADPAITRAPVVASAVVEEEGIADDPAEGRGEQDDAYQPAPAAPNFNAGAYDEREFWSLLAIVGLATVAIVAYLVRPDPVTYDTARFKRALVMWYPVYAHRRWTPRAVKRFVNRVRFYAMRSRSDVLDPTRFERFCRPFKWAGRQIWSLVARLFPGEAASRERGAGEDQSAISFEGREEVLVALGAIQEFQADWLKEPQLWSDFGSFLEKHQKDLPVENDRLAEILDFSRTVGDITGVRSSFGAAVASMKVETEEASSRSARDSAAGPAHDALGENMGEASER